MRQDQKIKLFALACIILTGIIGWFRFDPATGITMMLTFGLSAFAPQILSSILKFERRRSERKSKP